MKINQVELSNFRPFSLAEIQNLKMYPSSPIQIFIGDNGSGKSSLLNELNPFAAIKPMYDKKGKKQIHISHNDNEFVLTSDFSVSGGAHSFLMNGVELNIGGTATIQNELAEFHMGYSSLVEDITHLNYKMCSMTKTDRKNLLISMNPVDLTLVLNKHKYVCSKLREFKNNLSLLYKKKQEIDTQLISLDILKNLEKEKSEMLQTYNTLNNEIYHLTELFKEINSTMRDLDEVDESVVDLTHLKDTIKEMNVFLYDLSHIQDRSVSSLDKEISSCNAQENDIEKEMRIYQERIMSVMVEIQKYTKNLEDFGSGITIESLEKDLKYLVESKRELDPNLLDIPESSYPHHVSVVNQVLTKIYTYMDNFRTMVIKESHLEAVERMMMKLEYRVSDLYKKIQDIDTKLLELDVISSHIPRQIQMMDICTECEYFNHFNSQILEIQEKKSILIKMKEEYSPKLDRYLRVEKSFSKFVTSCKSSFWMIREIVDLLSTTVFHMTYDQFRLRYKSNPNKIIQWLRLSVDQAPLQYMNMKLDKQIEDLKIKLAHLKSSSGSSSEILQDLIKSRQMEMNELKSKISSLHQTKSEIHSGSLNLKEMVYWVDAWSEIQKNLMNYLDFTVLKANKTFCHNLIQSKQQEVSSLNSKLIQIDSTLKDQHGLRARLEDTLKTISEIEKQRDHFSLIEYGVSPYYGFPHHQMVEFINVLIHNVNHVLSQVWTYPLTITPLEKDSPVDGTFSIMVDDILVPDISKLSRGQKAIVDLAWTFSFMLCKKLQDYPLFLDEVFDGLDPAHTERTMNWIKSLTDDGFVSQIWLVHHEAVLFDFFNHSEILSLMSNNIVQCENLNSHVSFG